MSACIPLMQSNDVHKADFNLLINFINEVHDLGHVDSCYEVARIFCLKSMTG